MREEYQGTNNIIPALILGLLGIMILGLSIIYLKNYQNYFDEESEW